MRVVFGVSLLATLVLGGVAQAQQTSSNQSTQIAGEYPGLETGKMWTFDVPPLEYWARRYNFRPTQDWLDHARLAALRLPGCTASFVSGDGLIMTNHHCARACIDAVTQQGEDLLTNGFYARTRADERKCPPSVYVDQLLSISDVTDSVTGAIPANVLPARAAQIRDSVIGGLQQRCGAMSPDLRCQVVTMYQGGQYKLYRFRRFNDLRLVMAPEDSIAFFGGDPDNFTYPRYDVDMSFMRAYIGNEPAHTEYFRWSQNGSSENDLVFVVGNPGSTGRLNTMAQLEYLRDVAYPAQIAQLGKMVAAYDAAGRASPARASEYRNTMFGLQNSLKAITGYQSGLLDPQLMEHKRAWETDFRNRVNADPNLRRTYGQAWDAVATIRRQMTALFPRRTYHSFNAYGSRLLQYAGAIVRNVAESAKPDSARLPQFRGPALARMDQMLSSNDPVDTTLEINLLTDWLTDMAGSLPVNDPVRRAALGNKTPEAAARDFVTRSTLMTGEARHALFTGGAAAVNRSTDPLIALAKVIDPLQRDVQRQWDDLTGQEAQQTEKIARALFAVFGNSVAPDATFSLRIQDGEIKRYPYNGTLAQPFTTYYGMFDRFYGFGQQAPWNLPQRWIAAKDSINLRTPLNVVGTNDIIGGNSGSPVISRDGEVVGLIFDGNIESLPLRFLFTERVGRSVWVDSRGIIEALRHVYGAGALADELVGRH